MAPAGDRPSAACEHPRIAEDGACAVCGSCPHEIVLNGACLACGATDVTLDHKRDAADGSVVPADRLTGRRG